MASQNFKSTIDYVAPLNINGLDGRVLKLPAPKHRPRDMLLLYGSHSSLERMFSLATELNKYGAVTLPDWPGFGGMDSLFKIGKKPTIDNMADYLATFVKMRYRRRRFTIVGMSYGFAVATRMLQKYPEIAKRVDMSISIVGFAHYEDFHMDKTSLWIMKNGSRMLRGPIGSRLARLLVNDLTVGMAYKKMARKHIKMKDASGEELQRRIDFEKILWRVNDMRTYFYTGHSMMVINLCNVRANAPAYHVAVAGDQFFNNQLVEQHLAIIYPRVTVFHIQMGAHMPTIVASPKEVAPFIPRELRKMLAGN